MNKSIYGARYAGLVNGTCLSEAEHELEFMDVDPVRIEYLKRDILPIWVLGLGALVGTDIKLGRLHSTTKVAKSVHHGQVQFIAVGTSEMKTEVKLETRAGGCQRLATGS